MNKVAVTQLLNRWTTIPRSYTTSQLFVTKNLKCDVTSNGNIIFTRYKSSFPCSCFNQPETVGISMADVILMKRFSKLFRKDTLFICTEDRAIELNNIGNKTIEIIEDEVKKWGAKLSEMHSYERAFRFSPIKKK